MGPAHRRSWPWTIALLPIVLATLTPQESWDREDGRYFALAEGVLELPDVFLNAVLYIPLGWVARRRGLRTMPTLGLALALAVLIEVAQFGIPGRDARLLDACANGAGAALGALLAGSAGAWSRRKPVRKLAAAVHHGGAAVAASGTLPALLTAGAVGAMAASAWLAQPAPIPAALVLGTGRIDSRAGPVFVGGDGTAAGGYSGTIDEVRIYGRALTEAEIRADVKTPVADRSSIAAASLLAAYGFDEGSGTRVVDGSGRGNDGVAIGTSWIHDGRFGGAMSFDGRGSRVEIPAVSELGTIRQVTVEAWIRPTGRPAQWPIVVGNTGEAFYICASSDSGRYEAAAGGTFGSVNEDVRTRRRLIEGRWTHLAMTYDGTTLRLYRDGQLERSRVRWYAGNIHDVTIGGERAESGPLPDSPTVAALLVAGGLLSFGVAPQRVAVAGGPLLQVLYRRGHWREVLDVRADGIDLVIRYRSRARAIGLTGPRICAARALEDLFGGRSVQVEIDGLLTAPTVRVDGRLREVEAFTPGRGWALIASQESIPAASWRIADFFWLALLALPAGLAARTARGAFACGAGLAGVAFVLPYVAGIGASHTGELAGALVGAMLGWLCRRRTSRRATTGTWT